MKSSAVQALIAALGEDCVVDQDALFGLAEAIDDAMTCGSRAWDGVVVNDLQFATFLGERISKETPLAEGLKRMPVEDLYLACACSVGAEHAAEAFERAIMPAVSTAIARIDSTPAFIDEVSSAARIRLLVGGEDQLPRITNYFGHGPLSAFAQVVALRLALNCKRRVCKEEVVDPEALVDAPLSSGDPELARLRDEVREPFRRAFRAALAERTARERILMRLYFVEDVSSETLARMYRVHRGTIARWIAQARAGVAADIRKRLMRELQLGPATLESLMGQLISQLDVSLTTLIPEDVEREAPDR